MNPFTWEEFVAPLDPWTIGMSFVLGLFLGFLLDRLGHHFIKTHVYWMAMGGVVFFIPLALLRALDNSTTWERYLAALILWLCFSIGMRLGSHTNGRRA